MHCKSHWLKASAKCINVNVRSDYGQRNKRALSIYEACVPEVEHLKDMPVICLLKGSFNIPQMSPRCVIVIMRHLWHLKTAAKCLHFIISSVIVTLGNFYSSKSIYMWLQLMSSSCRCRQGFSGKNCEEIIDFCKLLNINCLNEGLCLSLVGGYNVSNLIFGMVNLYDKIHKYILAYISYITPFIEKVNQKTSNTLGEK